MGDIMEIDKIEITDNDIYLIIYPKENSVLINNEKHNISNEEIEKLLNIVMVWNHNYYSNRGLDGIRFSVKIYSDNQVDEYRGLREVPDNYLEFSNLVRGLYDKR